MPLQIAYILIPFLWADWLRPGTGIAWLAVVVVFPMPEDVLASPLVVSFMFAHLAVATLLNLMDAAAHRKER